MKFNVPEFVKHTGVDIPFLGNSFNGVFRGDFTDCIDIMPELKDVFETFPLYDKRHLYEFDVKVHMLKKGQYPCIPYIHCDFVPRVDGNVRYDLIDKVTQDEMFLWISNEPCPMFMMNDVVTDKKIESHADLNELAEDLVKINPKTWYSMNRLTPHTGTKAANDTWRLFIRAAKKTITPELDKNCNHIRRHSQVYIDDLNFSW